MAGLIEKHLKEDQNKDGDIDNDGKDAWSIKIPSFNKGDMKYHLEEETRFEIIFPKYREKYIKECWPLIQKLFDTYGVKCDLDLLEGIMSVSTTRKTWDPYIILKARDIIKLLGRSVPFEQAIKVLKDGVTCEIIKIKNLVRNKERLLKRRQRLIGSNGTALKTLELLTDCYVLVQGCTVATIGPHKGVQQVVRVVLDTMRNIHPVNLLKALMVKRTLAQDPSKKNEDWSKYLPSYSNKNVQRKKPKKLKKKKPYTPFPPERPQRKEDEEMESGHYFVDKEDGRIGGRGKDRKRKQEEADERRKLKRSRAFEAPSEEVLTESPRASSSSSKGLDLEKLKKKIKNKLK